jgi:hypothetical protein
MDALKNTSVKGRREHDEDIGINPNIGSVGRAPRWEVEEVKGAKCVAWGFSHARIDGD